MKGKEWQKRRRRKRRGRAKRSPRLTRRESSRRILSRTSRSRHSARLVKSSQVYLRKASCEHPFVETLRSGQTATGGYHSRIRTTLCVAKVARLQFCSSSGTTLHTCRVECANGPLPTSAAREANKVSRPIDARLTNTGSSATRRRSIPIGLSL